MSLLSETDLADALQKLPGWTREENAICRHYVFSTFMKAIAFIDAIAPLAEAADHHPDLRNVYNRVTVCLSTHDAGGITQKDMDLARRIEDVRSQ
ncbi:MAG: 4a-hydroxytetrahydrobiopterin dehydratase [candidate division Zixibacteria bacterium]|nr:4a-hydroxytetrahydrobiopterin dehydratase [candidate division Zixibacteria bacterium]